MCGIAGIFHFDTDRQINLDRLKEMTDQLVHRGPDGKGYFVKDNIGLGHRRLAIIDLSTGNQPMFSEDENLAVVFNGEIYNYLEVREELSSFGYRFRTQSDTEVILNAYKHWGIEFQNKLNGMWAIALWDNKEKQLLVSRDRLGEKPLCYSVYDNSFIFGSEIKSLISYGVPSDEASEFLKLYLHLGFVPAPYSFYKHVKKLEAGKYLIVKAGVVNQHTYWDLPDIKESDLISEQKNVFREFEHLFKDSVKIRMRSDVPFGAFLSGGLDSSCIVAAMSEFSDYPVETFTIGFDHASFDESKLAEQVSRYFKTRHHLEYIQPESLQEALDITIDHFDEPFGDPAAIPTGYLSKYARQKVKMVLTGDGGDEALSGYRAFRGEKFAKAYQKFPIGARNAMPYIVGRTSKLFKNDFRYKMNRIAGILERAGMSFEDRLLQTGINVKPDEIVTEKNQVDMKEYIHETLKECKFTDPFYRLMFLQLKSSLPEQMLMKVDRMSMAYSLETRIPFLDYRIIELLYQVDKNIKLPGYQTKNILRKTIGTQLPAALLKAPKRGFNVPLREWFKDGTFDHTLNSLKSSNIGMKGDKLGEIIDLNRQGKADFGNLIWRILVFQRWMGSLS